METEVGQITSALSHKLVIEDIDESDQDNPQLCAEYVKEIYTYMRELEVSHVYMYTIFCCYVALLQYSIIYRYSVSFSFGIEHIM